MTKLQAKGGASTLSHQPRENFRVAEEGAMLVGVELPDRPLDDYPEPMAELRGLAQTAGAKVLGMAIQKRQKPDQTTYVGKGKLEEISNSVHAYGANVIIFDNELEPAQVQNLEKSTETKVVDRTELILDIFAQRATSSEARLQVELAQLEYLRPRLKRMWTHLERLGGGIGTRGPGEAQLETDRRLIDKRIRDLREKLLVVQKRREREVQSRSELSRVCLVGYTNAGKSTLMRELTGADVLVANKLFSTLETRTRQWMIPNLGKVLLSDTVGFIRNLPHDLVASFKATLEETIHADLLLHVVDAANPSAEQQIEAVNGVLEELGVAKKQSILVLNQLDRVEDIVTVRRLESLHPRVVTISAKENFGLERLQAMVAELLSGSFADLEIEFSAGDGKLLAFLSANGRVFEKKYVDDQVHMRVRTPRALIGKIDPKSAKLTVRDLPEEPVPQPQPTSDLPLLSHPLMDENLPQH